MLLSQVFTMTINMKHEHIFTYSLQETIQWPFCLDREQGILEAYTFLVLIKKKKKEK